MRLDEIRKRLEGYRVYEKCGQVTWPAAKSIQGFQDAAPEDISYLLARVEKLEGLLTRLLPAVEFKRDPAGSIAAMKAVDELRELARTLLAGEESK